MAIFKNTFAQGMDRDSSKNKYDNTHYYEAQNLRTITQDGLSSGAIENVAGNLFRVNTITSENNYICGHVILRDHILLWTSTNNTSVPSGSSTDRVWKMPISSIENLNNRNFVSLSTTFFHNGGNLLYENNLYLCTGNRVRAVARYENDDVEKIYWVDGNNLLRQMNTVYNPDTNIIESLNVDKLDVIGDIELTQPQIVELLGGNLKAGRIQYAYQLYQLHGAETVFSTVSDLVNLTGYSEIESNINYRGSDVDAPTGKAVKCSIMINTAGYNRVRIIAIHYSTLQGDPSIRIVEERELSGSVSELFTFIDTGTNIGSLLLEDFRLVGTTLFSAKEISTKDNILFPANIKEQTFDVDYDARAYRFAGASNTSSERNYNSVAGVRQKALIYQEDESCLTILADKSWSHPTLGSGGDWSSIPEEIDAINRFNNLSNDGDHNYRFMYQSDGAILGGEGPNVKYEFKLQKMKIDVNGTDKKVLTCPVESTNNNKSYTNYASPYNSAKYVGYHRDEIYRWGIVFFDDKGRSSFTKWIADIRMPSMSTQTSTVTYGEGGQITPNRWTVVVNKDSVNWLQHAVSFGSETWSFKVAPQTPIYSVAAGLVDVINVNSSIAVASNIVEGVNTASFTVSFSNGDYTITTHTYNWGTDGLVNHGWDDDHSSETLLNSYIPGLSPYYDFSISYIDTTDNYTTYSNLLYLYFKIENIPVNVSSYQIVRVKREASDRTVLAQGVISGTSQGATPSDRISPSWNSASGWTDVYNFQSPEIAFNKNLVKQSNDYIRNVGTFADVAIDTSTRIDLYKYSAVLALTNPQTIIVGSSVGMEHSLSQNTTISDGALVTQNQREVAVSTFVYSALNETLHIEKGISFVFSANNTSWEAHEKATATRHLANYRRNIFNTQYGGNTYNARRRNIYIPTGAIKEKGVADNYVFGGDTYIGMFDYLYSSWEDKNATVGILPEVIYFPCESSINFALRMDDCFHRLYAQDDTEFLHDTKGIWGNGTEENDYKQETDLYRYNTVYSKENDSKLFISKPFDWTSETIFDCRILASQLKTNNEFSDSWLKFGANSYLDVDPQYGELIALVNNNNQMLFFQPKAFGSLSINERALLQTQTVSSLSLGTSGILTRYDYAKTEMGTSHRDHIILTPNGLYWLDVINKAMYKYTNGTEEISLMKGMQSWFKTTFSGSITLSSILLFYDPLFKEVNLVDNIQNINLVYNEITDAYTSFYSYYPKYIINYNDKVLSSDNRLSFYRHNDFAANRCEFYDNPASAFSITLIVNPSGGDIATFTNLEWLTEVYNTNDNVVNETFSLLRIANDYQDTDDVTLTVGSNVKRRIRTWRHTIGRALLDEVGNPMSRNDARIRDSYVKLKLEFNNTVVRRFIAHDITTSFMIANK